MDTENMKTLVEQNGSQSAAVLGELVGNELLKQNGNQAGSALGELADSDLLAQNGNQAAAGFGKVYGEIVEDKELVSIDAVFTQGAHTVYPNTPLNTLKQWLVVTATYDDESTKVLSASEYSLSGTLSVGNSTITASYQGKTDTFTVAVSAVVNDYYVGVWAKVGANTPYDDSAVADFALLNKDELVAASVGYQKINKPTIKRNITQADLTAAYEIFFLMWKSGSAPVSGTSYTGGVEQPIAAADFTNPAKFNATHDTVTIDGTEYTVVGTRNNFATTDWFQINF